MEEQNLSVETLTGITDDDAVALKSLLGQLSTTATYDRSRFDALVAHDATELLVARVNGKLVGTATLVTFPLPTGGVDMSRMSSWTNQCVAAASPGCCSSE